jgi:hypothetical protein
MFQELLLEDGSQMPKHVQRNTCLYALYVQVVGFFNKINSATGFSYLEDYCTHLQPATPYNAHSAVPGRQVRFQQYGHYPLS